MLTTAFLKQKAQAVYQSKSMRQGSVLFLGRAGAQLIALLSYPLLARWYTPAQFGEFALFSSILSILLVGASGRYEEALVLSRRPQQAKKIFQLAQLCLLCFVSLLFLCLFFPPLQHYLLEQEKLSPGFYWLLPVLVLCGGYWQIVQNWLIRSQQYAHLSLAVFLQRLLIFAGAAAAVFFSWAANGLLIGLVAGFIFIIGLGLFFQRQAICTSLKPLRTIASAYRDFPLYSVPTVLLDIFSFHLPVLWFTFFYSKEIAGSYSLAFTLISIPLVCLRVSIGDMFYRHLAQCTEKSRAALLLRYSRYYALILGPCVLTALLFGESIMIVFLGESWQLTGSMICSLAPFILARGLTGLMLTYFTVNRKQKITTASSLLQLILWTLALASGLFLNSILHTIQLMSLGSIVIFFTSSLYLCFSGKTLSRKKTLTSV